MTVNTTLMEENQWTIFLEAFEDKWREKINRTDFLLKEMKEQLSILFGDDVISISDLEFDYDGFCQKLLGHQCDTTIQFSHLGFKLVFKDGFFHGILINNISPIGWGNSVKLKEEVAQTWVKQNKSLPRMLNTVYIRSVIEEIRKKEIREPQSVYDAFFNSIDHYSDLYGDEFDFQLKDGFKETVRQGDSANSEDQENSTIPNSIAIEIAKLVMNQLYVSGVIKSRKEFWSTDQKIIEEFSSFLPSTTKTSTKATTTTATTKPKSFLASFLGFWKRIFKIQNQVSYHSNKASPQGDIVFSSGDTVPWDKLVLNQIPFRKDYWKLIQSRFEECVNDSNALTEANEFLESLALNVKSTTEELRKKCNEVNNPKFTCIEQQEFDRLGKFKEDIKKEAANVSNLFRNIDI